MVRLLIDEDFNNIILRGLQRVIPSADIVRVQDVGLRQCTDQQVLAWAADQGRVVVTHDVSTMSVAAFDRIRARLPMPGLMELSQSVGIAAAIAALEFILVSGDDHEWEGLVVYLPIQ